VIVKPSLNGGGGWASVKILKEGSLEELLQENMFHDKYRDYTHFERCYEEPPCIVKYNEERKIVEKVLYILDEDFEWEKQ
jgi:hypothetical protein